MILDKVDARVAELTRKLAGDKLDIVLIQAEDNIAKGKKPERALADALETFRLV